MTKKKFSPIFLGENENTAQKVKTKIERKKNHLENAVTAINEFVGEDLNDNELTEIIEGGFSTALNKVREQFQFDSATDEFNLKALGKDNTATIKRALKIANLKGFEVKDGQINMIGETKQSFENAGLFYTENQAQNKAYKDAQALCKILNKMAKSGYIEERYIPDLQLTYLPFLKFERGLKDFQVSPKEITRIGEDGK